MSEFLEQIFSGKYGGVAIMLVITAAIVFFLRALYGPNGRFRDPKWDENNKRIRQQEAEARERRLNEWLGKEEAASGTEAEQKAGTDER